MRKNHRIDSGCRRQIDNREGRIQGLSTAVDTLTQGQGCQSLIAGKSQAAEQTCRHVGKEFRHEKGQVLSWPETPSLRPHLIPRGVAKRELDARRGDRWIDQSQRGLSDNFVHHDPAREHGGGRGHAGLAHQHAAVFEREQCGTGRYSGASSGCHQRVADLDRLGVRGQRPGQERTEGEQPKLHLYDRQVPPSCASSPVDPAERSSTLSGRAGKFPVKLV